MRGASRKHAHAQLDSLGVVVPEAALVDARRAQLLQPLIDVDTHFVVVLVRLVPQSENLPRTQRAQ